MADNSIDGALGTSATIDSSGATKGSKEYIEALNKMEAATDKAVNKINASLSSLNNSEETINELVASLAQLKDKVGSISFSSALSSSDVERLANIEKLMQTLVEQGASLGEQLAKVKKEGEEAANAVEQVAEVSEEMENLAENTGELAENTEKLGDGIDQTLSKVGKAVAAYFAYEQIKGFVGQIMEVRSEFQSLEASFKSLTGSEAIGKKLFADITEYATSTPLLEKDLAQGAQTMLGFGIEANKVMGYLKEIGDVSMGDSQKMQSLTLAFSQIQATGKLMGQDLMQLINAGFNPLKEMARTTGKSMAELKDEMSEGKISAQMVADAFKTATEEGGQFHDMLKNQAAIMKGARSNFEGAMQKLYNALGEQMEGSLISAMNTGTELFGVLADHAQELSAAIVTLVTTLGTYKAACIAVTTVQAIQKAATEAGTIATLLAEKAQALLNKTMLKNPYIAVATALAFVVTGIYEFVRSSNQASESQERLNTAMENIEAAATNEKAKIDDLFGTLRKAKEGTKEYEDAKKAIIDQYGSYLQGLSDEIQSLKDVEGAYKAVATAATQAARARAMQAEKQTILDDYGQKYGENVKKIFDAIKDNVGREKASQLIQKLKKDVDTLGDASYKTFEEINKNFSRGIGDDTFREILDKIKADAKQAKELLEDVDTIYGATSEEPDDTEEKKSLKDIKAQVQKIKQAEITDGIDSVIQKVKDLTKGVEAGSDIETYLKQQIATLEAKKKKQEGANSRRQDAENARRLAAEEKLRKILDKDARQRIRQEEDLELEAQQNMINLMEEGAEKQLAQRELNHKKAMLQIQRESEDRKNALVEMARNEFQNDASNKGKNFDAEAYINSDTFKTQSEKIDKNAADKTKALQLNYDREEQQAKLQALYEYLEAYGTAEEKRFAITKKYEEEIAKAKDEYTKEALKNRMQEELKALNAQDAFNSINWDTVFTDLSSHTKEYLVYLRDELQKLISSNKLSNIADIEKVQQKINELNVKINDKSGLFEFKGERAMERERLQANVTNAQREFSNAIGDVGAASAHLESLKATNASVEAIDAAEKRLARTREKAKEAAEKLKNAEDSAERDSAQAVADWFADAQEFIAKKGIDQLPNLLDSLGMGDVGEKVGKGLSGFGNAAGAAADFASGNYVGAALKAVSAIKDFGSALGIGGGNAAEVNKLTEQNTRAIERLNGRLESLTKALDNANGVQAVEISQQMVDIQKEINQLASETLQAQMGYNSAHHSNDYYANDAEVRRLYNADARRAEKLSGVDMPDNIKGIGDVEKMTPEQLNAIRTYMPKLWEYLTTVGKYDKSEYWDAVADQAGKVEDIVGKLNEKLTMTSFDSLRDSWLGTLSDMESSSEDFANSFSDMMYKAMVNSFVLDEEFDKWLKEWQEKYAKAVQNNDTDALEGLRNDALDMREKKIAERERLAATMGYDGGRTAQEATANGIKSITADQADQLVGRITAMQIAVEAMKADQAMNLADIKEFSSLMQSDVSSIKGYMEEQNGYISEIADIQYESNRYLHDIAKNTSHLELIAEDITRIKENTSRL